MSEEELINELCNKFVTGDNYDSRYTDDIYNSIIKLDQYKNNWEELKKILNEMILDTKKPTVLNNREKIAIRIAIEHILNKMKELEEES